MSLNTFQLITAFVMLITLPVSGLAQQTSDVEQIKLIDCSREVQYLSSNYENITELNGEIRELMGDGLILLVDGLEYFLPFREELRIYMNGRPAGKAAIRPVTPDSGVVARVWVDAKGSIWLIDGYYQGVEVEVVYAEQKTGGGYRLGVRAIIPDNSAIKVFETTSDCKGLEVCCTQTGIRGPAFILFDLFGRIRGVYQR